MIQSQDRLQEIDWIPLLMRTIGEMEYCRDHGYSPDLTTIKRLKDSLEQFRLRLQAKANAEETLLLVCEVLGCQATAVEPVERAKYLMAQLAPTKQSMIAAIEKAVMKYPYFTAREVQQIAISVADAACGDRQ